MTRLGSLTGAAYPAMLAFDLIREAPAHPFHLQPIEKGKSVVILGAGLAGMAAAYELMKLGYDCTILEARDRAGGRVFTIRNGSTHDETVNGRATASFDDGQYFNAGPSRIPHHHRLTLHYCKELGVPLQVYNHIDEAAYYFSEGTGPLSNRKLRKREVHNDMRGYTSELLMKAIDQGALDSRLSKEDGEKLVEYLRAEGALDPDSIYRSSARRGYTEEPGAGELAGRMSTANKLDELIRSGFADPAFYGVAEYAYELQMTLFQAVGGNDQLVKAFEQRVGKLIRKGRQVTSIRNGEAGVTISYNESGGPREMKADYCICTIPLPVLSNIDHNFSSPVSRAIDHVAYIHAGKIGLQFRRRFWEEDEMIYGGITNTNNELYQIFYPSHDYQAKKGLLIGYYNFNERAAVMGKLSYADREAMALKKGALIHPQYADEYDGRSLSVSWQDTTFSQGAWAIYSEEERQSVYKKLLVPDGRVHFAGEHLTYLNGWMAGALESARATVTALHARISGSRDIYPVAK